MTWKCMLILPVLFTLTGCPWDKKADDPPAPSKPYNILDYTKPVPKP